MDKLSRLASERAFAESVQRYVACSREVYRADRPGKKVVLNPALPDHAWKYYYQIRSNMIHRGKAVVRDHERIEEALSELLKIFRDVLATARGDARWTDH